MGPRISSSSLGLEPRLTPQVNVACCFVLGPAPPPFPSIILFFVITSLGAFMYDFCVFTFIFFKGLRSMYMHIYCLTKHKRGGALG